MKEKQKLRRITGILSAHLFEPFTRWPDMKPVYVADSGKSTMQVPPPLSDSYEGGMDMKKPQSSPTTLPNSFWYEHSVCDIDC